MHWCGCQGNTEVQTDAAVIAPGHAEEARARPKRSWQTSLRPLPLGLYFPESEWNQHRVKVFRFTCVRGLTTLGLSCVRLCKEASQTGRGEGADQVGLIVMKGAEKGRPSEKSKFVAGPLSGESCHACSNLPPAKTKPTDLMPASCGT